MPGLASGVRACSATAAWVRSATAAVVSSSFGDRAEACGRWERNSTTNSAAQPSVSECENDALVGGLCAMARANSPAAEGVAIRWSTALAPADSPNTVTLWGFPPKARMLSCTHQRAATWSRSPGLLSRGRSDVEYREKSR